MAWTLGAGARPVPSSRLSRGKVLVSSFSGASASPIPRKGVVGSLKQYLGGGDRKRKEGKEEEKGGGNRRKGEWRAEKRRRANRDESGSERSGIVVSSGEDEEERGRGDGKGFGAAKKRKLGAMQHRFFDVNVPKPEKCDEGKSSIADIFAHLTKGKRDKRTASESRSEGLQKPRREASVKDDELMKRKKKAVSSWSSFRDVTDVDGKPRRYDFQRPASVQRDIEPPTTRKRTRSVKKRERAMLMAKLSVKHVQQNGKMIEVIDLDGDEGKEGEADRKVEADEFGSKGTEVIAISPDVQLESFAAEEVKISEEFMVLIRRKLRKKNRRLEGLSRAERDVLAVTMDKKLRRDEILTWVQEANIKLTRADFLHLEGETWLHDEIINSFVALINKRNRESFAPEASAKLKPGTPRVHCFNTFFFTKLYSGKDSYDYQGVGRWTKRQKINVLERDIILIPVNLSNYHWVCAYVDIRNRRFVYLDSMHKDDYGGVLPNLQRWIHDEVVDKYGKDRAKELKCSSWPHVYNEGIPRQSDGGSCGVFTTLFMERLERGHKIDFTQTHIPLLRKRMALQLLTNRLPTK